MSVDHYGVLGVSPTSEDVVIRAAYRALMRRYHPDADPSSEAADRSQAINAAYEVLSDPGKRARYDGSLAAQGLIKPDSQGPDGPPRRLVPGPAGFIGLCALAAAAMIVVWMPAEVLPNDGLEMSNESRPSGPEAAALMTAGAGSSTSLPSPAASTEVPNAMLEPADEILAPPDAPAVRRVRADELRKQAIPVESTAERVPPQPVERSAFAPAEPLLSCRSGTGWADRAICKSGNLRALDRQYGLLYAQSLATADDTTRAALLGSRERFQQKRSACRSENCLTNTYIDRLREVSDIMARSAQ